MFILRPLKYVLGYFIKRYKSSYIVYITCIYLLTTSSDISAHTQMRMAHARPRVCIRFYHGFL